MIVRTEPGYPAAVAEAVPLVISPSNPGAVQINTVVDYRILRRVVASDLSRLLTISSIVLLAVANLSAAVAMYLSIQARISEIVLRRAVRVQRRGIALLFVFEGALLGLAGAIGGVALGSLTTVLVAALSNWNAVLPTGAIWIGLLAGLLAGALSSFFPALRAARVSPALAIRN